MPHTLLRDDQWDRIQHLLSGKASDRGVTAKDNRTFLEAVLWIARMGSPWRDPPLEFSGLCAIQPLEPQGYMGTNLLGAIKR